MNHRVPPVPATIAAIALILATGTGCSTGSSGDDAPAPGTTSTATASATSDPSTTSPPVSTTLGPAGIDGIALGAERSAVSAAHQDFPSGDDVVYRGVRYRFESDRVCGIALDSAGTRTLDTGLRVGSSNADVVAALGQPEGSEHLGAATNAARYRLAGVPLTVVHDNRLADPGVVRAIWAGTCVPTTATSGGGSASAPTSTTSTPAAGSTREKHVRYYAPDSTPNTTLVGSTQKRGMAVACRPSEIAGLYACGTPQTDATTSHACSVVATTAYCPPATMRQNPGQPTLDVYDVSSTLDSPSSPPRARPAFLELTDGSTCEFSPGLGDPSAQPMYLCSKPSADLASFSNTFTLVGTNERVFDTTTPQWSATTGAGTDSTVSAGSTVRIATAWYVEKG